MMIERSNKAVALSFDPHTLRGCVELKGTKEVWELNLTEGAMACGDPTPGFGVRAWERQCPAEKLMESVSVEDVTKVRETHRGVALTLERCGAGLEVRIEVDNTEPDLKVCIEPVGVQERGNAPEGDSRLPHVLMAELPGPLLHAGGAPSRVAVGAGSQGRIYRPYQDGREERIVFDERAMRWRSWGVLTDRSGYAAVIEDNADADVIMRRDPTGNLTASVRWKPSMGKLAYGRRVTYCFQKRPTHAALMKRFRLYAMENGLWRSLEDKIAARPAVGGLIGAALVFIGYHESKSDYLAALRWLRQLGIEKMFVYPTYHISNNTFPLGGRIKRIDVRALSAAMHELGALTCSWTYLSGVDLLDGSPRWKAMTCRNPDGKPFSGWTGYDRVWSLCCRRKILEVLQEKLSQFKDAPAHHFDTTAKSCLHECYDVAHPHDCREDRRLRIDQMRTMTDAGYVLSSEGVKDWAVPHYDMGSDKEQPQWGAGSPYWNAPLQQLIYHDAIVSAWWECDNYDWDGYSGGNAVDQSLTDLLCGDPPLIFPAGWQYCYRADAPATRNPEQDITLPLVQDAARRAAIVAKHFARVGLEEMIDHRFLADDGSVQETIFKSGLRTVVNFGRQPHQIDGGRVVEPKGYALM